MKRSLYSITFFALLGILVFSGCSDDDEFLIKQANVYKPFTMNGFVVGGTLEQYFNGVKSRDLYQRISMPNQLGFVTDQMHMELRDPLTKEVVYEQTFNINDEANEVPHFYFDGKTFQQGYDYPEPVGAEFKANFFFDFPAEIGNVDVVAEVFEYYWDWDNMENPQVLLDTIYVTLAANIPTGKWSEYVTIEQLSLTKSREDSEFWPQICLRKAGKSEFIFGNTSGQSTFNLQIPNEWTSQGVTQSMYVGVTTNRNLVKNNQHVGPYFDLVPIFNPLW